MTTARKPNSRRPGGKPAPSYTDLDAIAAESTLEPFRFKWQGRDWEMLHQQQVDTWDVIREDDDLTRNQQILELFEIALGDQWQEFRELKLPLGLLQRLFDDYNAYCGTSPGEGVRSAGS